MIKSLGLIFAAAGDYNLGIVAKDLTDNFFAVVGDNIGPVLAILGTMFGVYWIMARFNNSRKGQL